MDQKKRRTRSIVAGSAGNLLEWYDWYIYSAFTLYFAPAFFPFDDPTVQLLSAAAVFAIGFVARPVGAWVLGVYADRKGRKAGLMLSVGLMCFGSLLIAITPDYAHLGSVAPLLLVIARLMQCLSVGGEYGTSATYLAEVAAPERRGFVASFQYVTLIAGQLIALLVLLLMQACLHEHQIQVWGWRVPFGLGAGLAVAVFYLRRDLAEGQRSGSPQSSRLSSSGWRLFRDYPKEAFAVMGMTAGGALAFYAYSTYMQKFLVNTSGFSRETATEITTAALFAYMLLQPAAGALSDKIGRRPLLIGFALGGVMFTWAIFKALESVSSSLGAFALVFGGLVIVTGYTSISAVVKAELFPPHIRALGAALPYALANAVFGGTAEYVALWFKSRGVEAGFYLYVTAIIGVSLVVSLRLPETGRRGLIEEP